MWLIKRLYHILAIFALVNLLCLAGLVGWLISKGRLTPQTARAMASVITGPSEEELAAQAEAEAAAAAAAAEEEDAAAFSATDGATELARLNLKRMQLEAEHKQRQVTRVMIDVTRRSEELDRKQQALQEVIAEEEQQEEDAGFQKDLQVISQEKPQVALKHLLLRSTEDAARLYMALDARRAKKINETAAKDPQMWAQLVPILQAIRDSELQDTEANAVSEPLPAADDMQGVN